MISIMANSLCPCWYNCKLLVIKIACWYCYFLCELFAVSLLFDFLYNRFGMSDWWQDEPLCWNPWIENCRKYDTKPPFIGACSHAQSWVSSLGTALRDPSEQSMGSDKKNDFASTLLPLYKKRTTWLNCVGYVGNISRICRCYWSWSGVWFVQGCDYSEWISFF